MVTVVGTQVDPLFCHAGEIFTAHEEPVLDGSAPRHDGDSYGLFPVGVHHDRLLACRRCRYRRYIESLGILGFLMVFLS